MSSRLAACWSIILSSRAINPGRSTNNSIVDAVRVALDPSEPAVLNAACDRHAYITGASCGETITSRQ